MKYQEKAQICYFLQTYEICVNLLKIFLSIIFIMDELNKEGHELVADLYLEIDRLNEEIKKLTEEIVQLKQPDGLELAMRDEADKYGFVLFNN